MCNVSPIFCTTEIIRNNDSIMKSGKSGNVKKSKLWILKKKAKGFFLNLNVIL